ncbi:ATP-grasp domain-containing protein [Rhizobium panacihumi]|uniref:ATP-grasp domain-containing protein n=1 Tax=Rhizobium panacihumi TaxID=2008450 RepID=UPI003D78F70D
MMTSYVIFIESNTSGTGPLFFEAARNLGYAPILLARDITRYAFLDVTDIRVISCDTSDIGSLLKVCRNLASQGRIAGIMTSSDYFVEAVARLTGLLNLPGPPLSAVKTCRNKAALRRALQQAHLEVLRFFECNQLDEVDQAVQHVGLPAVVKPIAGSGSVNVSLCLSTQEVRTRTAQIMAAQASEGVLIEQYVSGPEYSVELFNGRSMGITRKHLGNLPFFVETGHDFPAILTAEAEADITRHVEKICQTVGIDWGPAHVELKLDISSSPQIIEINPRLAGGFIPEIMRLACGVNVIEEFVRLSTGGIPLIEATKERHASIRFIIPDRDGTLYRIEGISEARSRPHIMDIQFYGSCPNEIVLQGNFRDRIGHVIAAADRGEDAAAAAQSALSIVSQSYLTSNGQRVGGARS